MVEWLTQIKCSVLGPLWQLVVPEKSVFVFSILVVSAVFVFYLYLYCYYGNWLGRPWKEEGLQQWVVWSIPALVGHSCFSIPSKIPQPTTCLNSTAWIKPVKKKSLTSYSSRPTKSTFFFFTECNFLSFLSECKILSEKLLWLQQGRSTGRWTR